MTTSTTWADIQRLAADLQRVQLAEGSKRLSEANCVEVVTMLMSMGLVQLVITTDGKEYVTRKHLVTECANECLAAGGRISLTELAAQLNVDLDHIQTAINQLLNRNRTDDGISAAEFVVCAGELVHREFINNLCVRINSRLEEHGQMSLLQLTKQWELSTEMLNFHILPEIGDRPPARICAVRFEENLCTPRYIAALRKKINAVLVAITNFRPIALSAIHSHLGVSQTLFFKLWNDLGEHDKMSGRLLGSKNSLKSLYIPNLHERMSSQYIKQRISVDHFIECLVLKRLNVVPSDPPAFFRELLPTNEFEDLIFWPSVVLSKSKLWRECDSLAKNILQSNHFCSIEDILPSQFAFLTDKDYAKIVERLQNYEYGVNLRATEDYSVVFEHPQLVDSWLRLVDGFVRERAAKDAPELRKAHLDAILGTKRAEAKGAKGAEKQQQKDDWEVDRPGGKKVNKSAGAKKGGGAGKGAAGKRKGGTESDAQAKYDPLATARLPTDELFDELRRAVASSVSDGLPESLCAELEEEFGSAANKMYRECLGEEYKKVDFGEQQGLKEIYEQKVAKFSESYADICLYEKGTEMFEENESLFGDLRTFLLRTLCTELSLSLLHAVAEPSSSQQAPQKFAQKLREQLIANLESKEAQKLAKELFDGLDSVEHFHEAVQRFASHGGAMLRQPDKRERSNRLDKFGTELRSQLADCSDPPTLLLLAVLLSLKKFFGVAVHASGKFVSPLILFISSKANKVSDPSLFELKELLVDTQRLVVACIRKERSNDEGGGGVEEGEEEKEQLTARMESLKAFFAENAQKSDML